MPYFVLAWACGTEINYIYLWYFKLLLIILFVLYIAKIICLKKREQWGNNIEKNDSLTENVEVVQDCRLISHALVIFHKILKWTANSTRVENYEN